MKIFDLLLRFILRFRYPINLPEEIAHDLGFTTTNFISFKKFIRQLTKCENCPRLLRFMPREEAEAVFQRALRKEKFPTNTLFSYYFQEGWLEFILHFDEKARLRRIYFQHRLIASERGIEIPLQTPVHYL